MKILSIAPEKMESSILDRTVSVLDSKRFTLRDNVLQGFVPIFLLFLFYYAISFFSMGLTWLSIQETRGAG